VPEGYTAIGRKEEAPFPFNPTMHGTHFRGVNIDIEYLTILNEAILIFLITNVLLFYIK
jgi:hypothetical protein